MKRRNLSILLIAEAAICVLLYSASFTVSGVIASALTFPFEQIGWILRQLSLSGRIGNGFAVFIYAAFCILPLVYLLIIEHKRELHGEDSLLVILSGLLFAVLYIMINPSYIAPFGGGLADLEFGKVFLGTATYSLLFGYLILGLLRSFLVNENHPMNVHKHLRILVIATTFILVYIAFGACLGETINSFVQLKNSNAGNESALGTSYLFLSLQYLIHALPYILDIPVAFSILHVLDELLADRYAEATVLAVKKLSHICICAIMITVGTNITFNFLQFLFMRQLFVINVSLSFPLMSILFVLATLFLTLFLKDNKQLKEDNDLFI